MNFFPGFVLVAVILTSGQNSAETKEQPFLLQFTHEVATTAGIGLLSDLVIPDNATEIRVWIGFGTVIPEEVLRLGINADGVVSGDVLIHFPSDLTSMGSQDASEFLKSIMRNCRDSRKGEQSEVCTATYRHEPDWEALYEDLLGLGIATLPDESELPKPEFMVMDGISMVVEVRNGPKYRAYQYSNPAFRDEPEARAATKIMRTIGAVISDSDGT